jgi:alanine dehydrogenase
MSTQQLSIGLARMHKEPGERRDFLPNFVSRLDGYGAKIVLEYGYGSSLSLVEDDYKSVASSVTFASRKQVFEQDYVLVLRHPDDDDVRIMRPSACLISMVHYPTRPSRVEFLRSTGIEAISLDSVKDDSGRRLIENLRAVAWNGVEAAFKVLRSTYPDPGFGSPDRPPVHATLMGAGAVGSHVVQAVTRYGDAGHHARMAAAGIPGVQLTVVDYDLTPHREVMRRILSSTDMLIDATQRPDPNLPVIPNDWVGFLPQHAVILDLSVDPYDCTTDIPSVKGVEGIPQGNLDQYIFAPDDPAFDKIPACFPTEHRRHTVSCYSWPGIYPKRCMSVYGRQIRPIMHILIGRGGVGEIDPNGNFFERAIARAMLSRLGDAGSN